MADISRRSFLGGALSVVAAAVTEPVPALATPACPTLHGDGVADDAAALNALLAGEPVWCEGKLITPGDTGWVHLKGGVYAIGGTVFVARSKTTVIGSVFIGRPDFEGEWALMVRAPDGGSIQHVAVHDCHLDMRAVRGTVGGVQYRVPEGMPRESGNLIGSFHVQTGEQMAGTSFAEPQG